MFCFSLMERKMGVGCLFVFYFVYLNKDGM